MFRRIVVGTDLSEACDRVIGCLHGLRPLGTEEAILVHALGLRHLRDIQPLLASYVEPRLAAQEALLRRQGSRPASRSRRARPSWRSTESLPSIAHR